MWWSHSTTCHGEETKSGKATVHYFTIPILHQMVKNLIHPQYLRHHIDTSILSCNLIRLNILLYDTFHMPDLSTWICQKENLDIIRTNMYHLYIYILIYIYICYPFVKFIAAAAINRARSCALCVVFCPGCKRHGFWETFDLCSHADVCQIPQIGFRQKNGCVSDVLINFLLLMPSTRFFCT